MAGKNFDLEREVPRIGRRAELLASWYMRFNCYSRYRGSFSHRALVHGVLGWVIVAVSMPEMG